MSASATSTTSAVASASSTAAASITVGSNLKVVGVILAVVSGCLIGSSFVFKKKGLLRAQAGGEAGEGVAYLKSPLWWLGMSMMILGELCNFAAYAFVEALIVTPLGALSVVICAILSSIFLKESLTFFGWLGCALCIIGSTIIALNGPQEASVGQIKEFQKLFLSPGFLAWAGVLIAAALVIIFYFAPKYGKKSMLWYIFVCSMIGGISVSVTTGLGAAIVTTASGQNQFKYWFIYFLMVFVVVTLVTEVYYLNVALALFNTAMVTPTYYVIFTFFSMVTSVILFQGLKASAAQIITVVMAFLVICCGITILQMSKIDPADLGTRLDRRSTMLLQASRSNIEKVDEKDLTGVEDPGIDSIRGSFGPLGSMIRARSVRRMSQSSRSASTLNSTQRGLPRTPYDGLRRHQLYDAPVPSVGANPNVSADQSSLYAAAGHTPQPPRTPTIKFGTEEVVHRYPTKGAGAGVATHEQRDVSYASPGQMSFNSVLPTVNEASVDGLPLQHPRPKHAIAGPPPAVDTSDYDYTEEPRTAPANLFGSQALRHDPFEMSPATAIGPSFAGSGSAATQPLPHSSRFGRGRNGEGSDEDEAQAAWRRDRGGRHKRASSERRYPRTGGEDDREESVSLVRSPSLDGDDTSEDEVRRGGIRLVGPSPGRF